MTPPPDIDVQAVTLQEALRTAAAAAGLAASVLAGRALRKPTTSSQHLERRPRRRLRTPAWSHGTFPTLPEERPVVGEADPLPWTIEQAQLGECRWCGDALVMRTSEVAPRWRHGRSGEITCPRPAVRTD